MASHHEPLKALSPIDWDKISTAELKSFLHRTFADASIVVESIPSSLNSPSGRPNAPVSSPTSPSLSSPGRARSHTDPTIRNGDLNGLRRAVSVSQRQRQSAEAMARAHELRKEWREVKVGVAGSRENPHGTSVYKLAGKDGRGNWFARRSVHEELSFDRWKLGLEHEFAETMKVQTGPGGGSIRGIGAERVVERHVVQQVGKAEVFQLSAQFPGPTAPRDFITLLLTSDSTTQTETNLGKPLREFIVVSKPCVHPDCPPRPGYVRGQYESVEIIREVSLEPPSVMRTRSSVDLTRDDDSVALPTRAAANRATTSDNLTKEAVTRAARKHAEAAGCYQDDDARSDTGIELDNSAVAVEWIMITRSDPGGSVPRFMIDKGTPGAIVADAGKFFKWLSSRAAEEIRPSRNSDSRTVRPEAHKTRTPSRSRDLPRHEEEREEENPVSGYASSDLSMQPVPTSNGLYGMIASAIGAAGSVVTSRLPNPFAVSYVSAASRDVDEGIHDQHGDDGSSTISDSSSTRSFASAVEIGQADDVAATPSLGSHNSDSSSVITGQSQTAGSSAPTTSAQEKDLKKLEQRRRKVQDKIQRMQERMASKRQEDREKDVAALARLREKHERDIAKQEERYRREMRRIEEKREAEQRKAEERRRKAVEREERNRFAIELDKLTAERDLARKEAELLRDQVGDLQRENTMLVAKLGRAGLLPRPVSGLGVSFASAPGSGSGGSSIKSAEGIIGNGEAAGKDGRGHGTHGAAK